MRYKYGKKQENRFYLYLINILQIRIQTRTVIYRFYHTNAEIKLYVVSRYHECEAIKFESENLKKSTPIAITNQGGSENLMDTF